MKDTNGSIEKPALSNGVDKQNGNDSSDDKEEEEEATPTQNGGPAVNGSGKKKKKKKQSKDGLKEKKEQKRFALEGQFNGMEMPSFSGVTLSENMNFEPEAEQQKVEEIREETPA